jgi:Nucleotidyltransferase domain
LVALSDDFLNALVAEFDDADTIGFALGGSHARGEANPYSDVDIIRFVAAPPVAGASLYRTMFRGGHLISIAIKNVAEVRQSLTRPQEAIWVAPGIGQLRILLDKDGSLAALLDEARVFQWPPVQDAANRYASAELAGLAEEAHKIMAGLSRQDEAAVAYATLGLALVLTRVIATQRGIMMKSENTYFPQVWSAVGRDSAWSQLHRQALGFDAGTSESTPTIAKGMAALHLYCETARLLRPILLPEHLEVVDPTLARIDRSDLLGGNQ